MTPDQIVQRGNRATIPTQLLAIDARHIPIANEDNGNLYAARFEAPPHRSSHRARPVPASKSTMHLHENRRKASRGLLAFLARRRVEHALIMSLAFGYGFVGALIFAAT